MADPVSIEAAQQASTVAVSLNLISKSFGATLALDNVSFDIQAGSVHALLGENGAGKSTLVKLLSGLIEPDRGTIQLLGQPVRLPQPRRAHRYGIQTAFQEMTLVGDLTVLENMLLAYAPVNALGLIDRRGGERAVSAHFAELGMADIDLYDEVRELDLAVQQKIEIARAIFRRPKILLLDEPTSSLSGRDVDWLGDIIQTLKASGVTTVFISHRIPEVRMFCDTLTVLRNGQHIVTDAVTEHSDEAVIRMIAGRSIVQAFPPRPPDAGRFGPEVLGAEQLAVGSKLHDVSFSLRQGEILGVAGLQGMGQLELFLGCYGMSELRAGQLRVDGQPVAINSPRDAIHPAISMGLLPEDRKTEALFQKLSGLHNASLPVIDRFARFGLINQPREREAVSRVFDQVEVDHRAIWTRVGAFSGGNQQKIAIAKWLLAESRMLLLYDPTRGIDIGTKHELYLLMRAYVEAGGALLFFSSEIPELVHMADRVLVFYRGRVMTEIAPPALTEEAIVRAALGESALGESNVSAQLAGKAGL